MNQSHFDRVADQYRARCESFPINLFKPKELLAVQEWLPQEKNLRCLDLGAGAGAYTSLLLRNGFTDVVATDISQQMLDLIPLPENKKFCQSAETPLGDKSYDLIICAGLLEFVDRPELLIANMSRALDDGGEILLLSAEPNFINFLYKSYHALNGKEVFFYNRLHLKELFNDANLEISSFKSVTTISYLCRLCHG